MVIEGKKVVAVHYTLTEGSADGPQVESSLGSEPLVFIYGIDMMIPDFESNLKGMKPGDSFAFGIEAANAYGEYDETAMAELPKSMFEEDGEIPDGLLDIGNSIPLQTEDGEDIDGTVISVGPENVELDFNHPLAGIDLFFTGHIESIRNAEPEELEHGHVHGADGHDH